MEVTFYSRNLTNSQHVSIESLNIGVLHAGSSKPTVANKPTFRALLVLLASCWLALANTIGPYIMGFKVLLLAVGSFLELINMRNNFVH